MTTVQRILELDADTDARIEALAAEKGQDASAVVADAIALLDSVIDLEGPDIREDVRRVEAFERSGEAIPGNEVKAWIES